MSYLDDPVYRAVQTLRDPVKCALILRRVLPVWPPVTTLSADPRIRYLDYKPFERARLVLTANLGGATEMVLELNGQSRNFDPGTGGSATPFSFIIPELGAHGWLLNDAPWLETLALVRDPDFLRGGEGGVLCPGGGRPPEVDLIRYVPRKRAVLAIDRCGRPGRVYAKVAPPGEAAASVTCLEMIGRAARAGTLDFRVPAVVANRSDLRTVFMSEVPGTSFNEVFGRADTTPFSAMGVALASLHRSKLQPKSVRTTADQLDRLRRHLAEMARALPGLGARLDALLAPLSALEPKPLQGPRCPTHGNLSGDNILWNGAEIGIIGWDRLALGDPLHDLGRLLAHLIYDTSVGAFSGADSALNRDTPDAVLACANALIRSFTQAAHCRIDEPRLTWHVAVELLLLAHSSALRTLSPGWSEQCAQAVEECEKLIDGASAFKVLSPLRDGTERAA